MDVAELLDLCLGFPGAWPDNPWDHEHPVVKVGEGDRAKIFAFVGADKVGLKAGANREIADEWLDRYPDDASVMAYIGRSGWNNLALAGAIPPEEIVEAVEDSYRMVVGGIPKKHRPTGWETV